MPKKLAKISVTSDFGNWREIELADVFGQPDKVQILGSVVDKGSLYLIYIYDEDDY